MKMSPFENENLFLFLWEAILHCWFMQKVSPPEPFVLKQYLSNCSSSGARNILYLFERLVEISEGRDFLDMGVREVAGETCDLYAPDLGVSIVNCGDCNDMSGVP